MRGVSPATALGPLHGAVRRVGAAAGRWARIAVRDGTIPKDPVVQGGGWAGGKAVWLWKRQVGGRHCKAPRILAALRRAREI